MNRVLLCHVHEPGECGIAFAAWSGYPSPLRRETALCSCRQGLHELLFVVWADDERAALAQLPPWLAVRAEAVFMDEVAIP